MENEQDSKAAALKLARGTYQRNLVLGRETLGGSTLRGKAKSYMSKYNQSARSLVARLKAAGIKHTIKLGPRGGWNSATLEFGEEVKNV